MNVQLVIMIVQEIKAIYFGYSTSLGLNDYLGNCFMYPNNCFLHPIRFLVEIKGVRVLVEPLSFVGVAGDWRCCEGVAEVFEVCSRN